ncbi:MAG TPA: vanadium-dependent haloperoxidase, partial [Flavisolibacter sp.]|nr:vanadium-dependent haloperoxidase [Flavisolibacter sp.]
IFSLVFLSSCKKDKDGNGHYPSYTAEVLDKWMTLQLRLMRNATGIPNQAFSRHFGYAGVAAVEALAPGYPEHAKWRNKWNGLTGLPHPENRKKYYAPANVNAAMAAVNKAFFPNAAAVDKQAIDSLEAALNQEFQNKQSQTVLAASAAFGKAVAAAVFNWAEGDGYKVANNPYTPPVGNGLWKPTPPAMAPAATPFWGNNRTIIYRSTVNTQPSAPPAYSTSAESPFYQMVKQVYDASQNLTDDQKAMAIFWRDVPGATSPGHWLSILQQVIRKKSTPLEHAALAYALTGIAINDALIACFKAKYQYNLVRPVTYIREVMGHANWNSFIGTPAHPEYVSAHSSLSAAAAAILQKLFGNIGSFTDHTYDYLGLAPRTYSSFKAIGEEAGLSRLYAGIHYQVSIDAGLTQGREVADNIFPAHYYIYANKSGQIVE